MLLTMKAQLEANPGYPSFAVASDYVQKPARKSRNQSKSKSVDKISHPKKSKQPSRTAIDITPVQISENDPRRHLNITKTQPQKQTSGALQSTNPNTQAAQNLTSSEVREYPYNQPYFPLPTYSYPPHNFSVAPQQHYTQHSGPYNQPHSPIYHPPYTGFSPTPYNPYAPFPPHPRYSSDIAEPPRVFGVQPRQNMLTQNNWDMKEFQQTDEQFTNTLAKTMKTPNQTTNSKAKTALKKPAGSKPSPMHVEDKADDALPPDVQANATPLSESDEQQNT